MERIDIPDRSPAFDAAGIVMEMMRRIGMDPGAALKNELARSASIMWSRGELTDAQFVDVCEKLMMFNPGLRL